MTEVLHTGDTHLGYRQYHLPERRRDFQAAFESVAADAVEREVDAVVHAGDLFHDRQPGLADIMDALSVLRTLDDADIPFLAVVGNHEAKRDRQWLDLFERLGVATRLGAEPVTVGDVALYGLDFVPRSKRDDLAYDFEPTDHEQTALVTHGLFEPFEHGDWDARELLAESTVSFDCLLLGDDHTPQQRRVEEPHEAWLTYCGSTERASASEREDRGYNLVRFGDGIDIRRRGLETREFVYVDVELAPGEGSQRIYERLEEQALEDAVVVVTIAGEGESVTPAEVEQFGAERGALATRVTDRRELATAETVDVSFADPDLAVRERIADLGLSTAARDIDETIRASKVADSNVTDVVEDRVRELVDEADPGAFEPAEGPTGEDERASTDERSEGGAATADDQSAAAQGDSTPATDETATSPAQASDTASAPGESDASGGESAERADTESGDSQARIGEY